MIEQPQIMAFLQNIHSRLLESVDLSDSKETLDELSELVAIFAIEGKDFLSELSEWDDIQTSIASVSKMKSKNHDGLSNKTVFKYMDIMDVIG